MEKSFLRVAACSYEGSLFGWNVTPSEDKMGLSGKMLYGFNVTAGPLTALAISGNHKYLAAGGYDERIRIYDLRGNISIGELSQHSSDITCLEFYEAAFLFSGSKDGTICVWRVRDWSCIHILKDKSGPIINLSVHPSGKLGLAVDSNKGLRVWNLMSGTCSYTKRLKNRSNLVKWNHDGSLFLQSSDMLLEVFTTEEMHSKFEVSTSSRINKAIFIQTVDKSVYRIVLALENMTVNMYDLDGKQISTISVDSNLGRLRDMVSCKANPILSDDLEEALRNEGESLVIVSSKGNILILSTTAMEETTEFTSVCQSIIGVKIEPRLTCVVAWTDKEENLQVACDEGVEKNSSKTKILDADSEPARDRPTKKKRHT